MTRAETDRSLLRAFRYAADYIKQGTASSPAKAERLYLTARAYSEGMYSVEGPLSRRQRVNERNLAHALATAWGL